MAASAAKRKPWSSREKAPDDAEDELLVFGYSCKLFGDDEKALYIERGKHLIPWMGDERLMIDRYDGRGYLHDLEQYEAKPGRDLSESLTEEEVKVENACDEERYAALYRDMSEEELYHEEELKRLRMALASDGAYNEVHFTYGEEAKEAYDPSEPSLDAAAKVAEDEQPFIAPEELGVPPGMELPPTERMNAIIEKTALFVAQHGLQMEIVIKTKQAKNQQLLFMQFDHPLNPYYKHVTQCIKSGKYKPNLQKKNSKDENESEDEDDDSDGDYLHPSLLASKSSNSNQTPSNYPTAYSDSYYSSNSTFSLTAQPFSSNAVPYTQQRQGDDWYSLLVKQLKDKVSKNNNQSASHSPLGTTPTRALSPTNPAPFVQSGYVASSAAPKANNSSAVVDPSLPTPPGLEPVTLPTVDRPDANCSGTDAGQTSNYLLRESHIEVPPAEIQPIVDKMAAYVAKNGKDFETVVLSKGDNRFEFLHICHQFHPYYLFKKSIYEQQIRKEGRMDDSANSEYLSAPVSFSIKSKEPEVGPLEKRNALASDESDSDETGAADASKDIEKAIDPVKVDTEAKSQPAVPVTTAEKVAAEETAMAVAAAAAAATAAAAAAGAEKARKKIEALELRMAEERLKDRLAAAAREKLSSVSREKQLQQIRKQKAALFLINLNQKEDPAAQMIGPQLPGVAHGLREERLSSCSDDDGRSRTKAQNSRPMSDKSHGSGSAADRSYGGGDKRASKRTRHRSRSSSSSPSCDRGHRSRRRSRSRSRRRSPDSRHSSPSSSSYSKKSKAKTPPAAYAVVRRSHSPSPRRARYRSHSRDRTSFKGKSSYTSRGKKDHRWYGSRTSKSPPRRRSQRSRSRSRHGHRRSSEERRSSSRTRRSRSTSRPASSKHGTDSPKRKRTPSPETNRRRTTASRSASPPAETSTSNDLKPKNTNSV